MLQRAIAFFNIRCRKIITNARPADVQSQRERLFFDMVDVGIGRRIWVSREIIPSGIDGIKPQDPSKIEKPPPVSSRPTEVAG